MNKTTAAICMLARDCKAELIHNIPKIEKIRQAFTNSIVVIVENDSIDGTKQILAEWKEKSDNIYILSCDTHDITVPLRTETCLLPSTSLHRIEKMCGFRNQYMRFLQEKGEDFAYLIIIDSDLSDFDINSILNAIINAPKDWVGLFANGTLFFDVLGMRLFQKYYDSYAYLPKDTCYNDLQNTEMHLNIDKLHKQLHNIDYINCKSAFGGIGIYRYKYVKNLLYTTFPNKRSRLQEAVCEHISFNLECLKYGENYIVSNMNVYYENTKNIIRLLLNSKQYLNLLRFLNKNRYDKNFDF